jgi:hypothetical protein
MGNETEVPEPGEREPKVIPLREAFSILVILAGIGLVWWGTARLAGWDGLLILSGIHIAAVGGVIGLTRNAPVEVVQPPTTRMEVRRRVPEDGPAHNHT